MRSNLLLLSLLLQQPGSEVLEQVVRCFRRESLEVIPGHLAEIFPRDGVELVEIEMLSGEVQFLGGIEHIVYDVLVVPFFDELILIA